MEVINSTLRNKAGVIAQNEVGRLPPFTPNPNLRVARDALGAYIGATVPTY